MKNTLPTLFILSSIALYFFVITDQYENTKAMFAERAEALEAEEKVAELRSLSESIEGEITQNQDQYEELDVMVPALRDDARSLMVIEEIADEVGVVLLNVSVEAEGGNQRAPLGGGGEQDEPQLQLQQKTVSMTVESSYSRYKEFLTALEESQRLIDVTSISVDASEDGIYSFNTGARMYWVE